VSRTTIRRGGGLVTDTLLMLSALLWLVHVAARDALSPLSVALILAGLACCMALARAAGVTLAGTVLGLAAAAISLVVFLAWNTEGGQTEATAVVLRWTGLLVAVLGPYLTIRCGRTRSRG
jgi:hypothetical protein